MSFPALMSDTSHDAVSIMTETPDGTVTVIIVESVTHRPIDVQIYIGKAGSSLRAWTQSLADMINLALRNGIDIQHVIQCLVNQNSDKIVRNRAGVEIQSGPAGIAYCLYRYNKYRQEQGIKNVERGSFRALDF